MTRSVSPAARDRAVRMESVSRTTIAYVAREVFARWWKRRAASPNAI
jgi:hypothetical protein